MNSVTKNRIKLVLLACLFVLPVSMSWVLVKNPELLADVGTKNTGQLINPAIPYGLEKLTPTISSESLEVMKGRWVAVHVDLDGECNEACIKAIHSFNQVDTLLNKDTERLERLYLTEANYASLGDFQPFLNQRNVHFYQWTAQQKQSFKDVLTQLEDGETVLMDPLGNLMMRYKKDADPYGVQDDLKLLFKASQIG